MSLLLFFGINDKILKSKNLVQQKLVHENKTDNDPEKAIFNFSKYELSDAEKKLLAKGSVLNLVLPNVKPIDTAKGFKPLPCT